jgi:CRISPR-associated endonuclease/helicase Cas3
VTGFLARPGQRVEEHLQNVAEMAAGALSDWPDMAQIAYAAGLLHDLGKCSCAWQEYLARATNESVGVAQQQRLEHVWTSADAADELLKAVHPITRRVITTAIVGHHGSLGRERKTGDPTRIGEAISWLNSTPDFLKRLTEEMKDDHWGESVNPLPPMRTRKAIDEERAGECLSAWVEQEIVQRIVQSALVDADWTDAQAAIQNRRPKLTTATSFYLLGEDFNRNNATGLKPPANEFDNLRSAVFEEAVASARGSNGQPGFYLLDAPTGIGKTRSSLGFAFAHAEGSKARRMIFAAPYISVTSQNVEATQRLVFGEGPRSEHILEHHSMAEGQGWKSRAATQNWDSPIVVTTSIQLLQSLHSCRLASIRKLHRLAGSIIVLDEWQTIPLELLITSMQTLSVLVRKFGTTVLLTSATPRSIDSPKTLIQSVKRVVRGSTSARAAEVARNRVHWQFASPLRSWADFADEFRIDGAQSKVAIVNTRAAAAEIATRISQADSATLHLSTSMTPAHREKVLAATRQRLANDQPISLIATQVIEAGVDVSFQVLWREAAPLEALVQAAGRCNRNGEHRLGGKVTVFEVLGAISPSVTYKRLASEALRLCNAHNSFPNDPKVMEEYETSRLAEALAGYSSEFRTLREAFWLERSDRRFIEIERKYQLIDDYGIPVICIQSSPVQINRLIEQHDEALTIGDETVARRIRRELSRHTVSLPEWLSQSIPPEEGENGLAVWNGPYSELIGVDTRK